LSIRPPTRPSAPPAARNPAGAPSGSPGAPRSPAAGAGSALAKTDPARRAIAATPTTSPGPTYAERAARNAAYAVLAFTLFTVITLISWFAREDQPWGFSSFVALLSALLGAGATALLWRDPTRQHAIGGLAVMGLSLLRVGFPTSWTGYSFALIALTILLAVPLAQAVIVLPRS
jgi:hypothetical protein